MAKKYIKKWKHPSRSREGKYYVVSLTEDGTYECNCRGWIFNRNCTHSRNVRMYSHRYEEIDVDITGFIVDISVSIYN